MTRTGNFRSGEGPESKLVAAHRLICEACNGPSMALLKGKAKRPELQESIKKLRMAISLMEEVLDA